MATTKFEMSSPHHPFQQNPKRSLLFPKISQIQKLFSVSRTIPLVILILFQTILLPIVTVQGQEYLSLCDHSDSKPSCLPNKFLVCLSNRCHCADEVNHIYDFAQDTCVIMTGRKCTERIQIKLGSSHVIDLDPRQLESDKSKQFPDPAFPRCQDNAFCDITSSTCKCKLGYFYNERSGQCELSLGKSCTPEDTIQRNKTGGKGTPSSVLTQLPYSSSDNLRGCDANVGLRCGTEGVCKCEDHSVWQIDIGCVSLLGSTTTEKSKTVQAGVGTIDNTGNDFISQANNFTRTIYYNNGDDAGLTPFQKLVNSYTKVLIEANNRYYLPHDDTESGMSSPNIELADKIIFSQDPQQNASKGNLKNNQTSNFVGDRNQFPGGGQQGQTNPIWNLLLPQKNTANRNSYNNTGGVTAIAKIQEQALQLQKLLIQQQQLQTLIDQLNDLSTSIPSQQPTVFPTASLLITPAQNNYLGNGNNQNFQQQTPNYNQFWNNHPGQQNNNQQTIGGAFPIFRLFKNVVDPIKRSIFPNLANAVRSLPSPVHLVASTFNNFLPVLRTLDRQFSPMLQNLVELTRPRQRIHNNLFPNLFNRGNNQNQQNIFSSNSNNVQGLQQLYQPNQGNPIFGNGNNYGPGTDFSAVVNQRNGRMREGNNENVIGRSNLVRRLWGL